MPDFSDEKSQRSVTLLRTKEEEESTKLLAENYHLPYADLLTFPIELDALAVLPHDRAETGEVAVFQSIGKELKVGIHNPDKEETKAALKHLEDEGFRLVRFLVSHRSLQHVWDLYAKVPKFNTITSGAIQLSEERIAFLRGQIKHLAQIGPLIEEAFRARTTDLLEIIMAGAMRMDASDVHLEPTASAVRIRYRLDGVLHDTASLPLKPYKLLLSRIKLVSEMKLNIHDRAQDGRFTVHADGVDVEIRASALPGPDGENIVLRILNPQALDVKFEDLGMQPWVREIMDRELQRPNGMIITTGPTGSGKTTTLYTMLKKIYNPEVKVITLEDPIEYHLPGIEQTRVDHEKGYDFPKGLRAIVRQDPDVILVGEIRDFETADTALNAALTGHLVFSTLHTNNAAGTIPRLINLGVKPVSIAPALNVAMGQRLVRKLCAACKNPIVPDENQIRMITEELGRFPAGVPTPPREQWTLFAPSPEGCEECNEMQYRGRIGVYEIILIGDALEEIIMHEPSEAEIKKIAATSGQITMRQDGVLKVLAGITDMNELNRVIGTEERAG